MGYISTFIGSLFKSNILVGFWSLLLNFEVDSEFNFESAYIIFEGSTWGFKLKFVVKVDTTWIAVDHR